VTTSDKVQPNGEHNPFAGWGDDREVHQRINAVHHENEMEGKSQQPKIVDFTLIDQIAKDMDSVAFGQISPLDRNKDAHDMALEYIDTYRRMRDFHGETIYADHLGVQLDPELAVQTANRIYGILASNPAGLHPLSNDWTWEQVSHKYLSRVTDCDVEVTIDCKAEDATVRFAIKAGEFAVIFASCQPCRDWFDADPLTRHKVQKRNFGTMWSVGKDREHRERKNLND